MVFEGLHSVALGDVGCSVVPCDINGSTFLPFDILIIKFGASNGPHLSTSAGAARQTIQIRIPKSETHDGQRHCDVVSWTCPASEWHRCQDFCAAMATFVPLPVVDLPCF